MTGLIRCGLVAVALLAAQPGFAASGETPLGLWRSADGKLTVKIYQCDAERLCGQIAGMSKPLDKNGKPKVDDKNPDPALRNRPLLGTTVFSNMIPEGDNKWRGQIYYAKNGGTYSATAKLNGRTFVVSACWTVVCKKFRFNKVD